MMRRKALLVTGIAALLWASPRTIAQKLPDGKPIFLAKCSTCHGRAGKPAPMYAKIGAVNLSDPDWQKRRSDDYIKNVVNTGSEGTAMRSFKDELKPEQIAAVVKFVRTLNSDEAK